MVRLTYLRRLGFGPEEVRTEQPHHETQKTIRDTAYEKLLYQGHRPQTSHQERTDFALPDFYPPIRHPKTGRMTRWEYLGIYIYTDPVEPFQEEYNRSLPEGRSDQMPEERPSSMRNSFFDHSKGKESL